MDRLVSVVLPVYNGEKYLSESIESVLQQTYKNWELILVDDGSTDKTAEIAKHFSQMDSRVRYEKNPENLKLPRSLNRGFSLANGDYLTWTSDDNLFYPQALEIMVETIENKQSDFVFASCDLIDAGGKIFDSWEMKEKMELRKILGANIVGACFLYTRKVYEIIGDYDANLFLAEDFDYWQRVFAKFRVSPIEEKLYAYRNHGENLTNSTKIEKIQEITEKTLLKNAKLYQKLDFVQKFYLYEGLYRLQTDKKKNPYSLIYHFYLLLHLLTYRLPRKLNRLLHKNSGGSF